MVRGLTGLKIRALRKERGLSQGELARRAGISASYLNLIELEKRAVGTELVDRIAGGLGVARSELDGEAERSVVTSLEEIAADPELAKAGDHPGPAEELVGRNPGWASLVLRLYHAWLDRTQAVLALADRLNRDPFLGESVHRLLTNATSIRAAAEILDADDALPPSDRRRFLSIVTADAQKLSGTAQSLLEFFDSAQVRVRSATPAEHVDAFILATDNYFPELEALASDFLAARRAGETSDAAVQRMLGEESRLPPDPSVAATAETRRFRLLMDVLRDAASSATRVLFETHPALASEEVPQTGRVGPQCLCRRGGLDALCAVFASRRTGPLRSRWPFPHVRRFLRAGGAPAGDVAPPWCGGCTVRLHAIGCLRIRYQAAASAGPPLAALWQRLPALGDPRGFPESWRDGAQLRRAAIGRAVPVLRARGGKAAAHRGMSPPSPFGDARLSSRRCRARRIWGRHRPRRGHGSGRHHLPAVHAGGLRPSAGSAADCPTTVTPGRRRSKCQWVAG